MLKNAKKKKYTQNTCSNQVPNKNNLQNYVVPLSSLFFKWNFQKKEILWSILICTMFYFFVVK